MIHVHNDDCLRVMRNMDKDEFDSIITDPPYGVGIAKEAKGWDDDFPRHDVWAECLRVLKPGGYIMVFCSARHYHRVATIMDEVGFETQNMLAWVYGSGFPRGHDLSCQMDRVTSEKPDDAFRAYLRAAIKKSGYKIKELEAMLGTNGIMNHYLGRSQPQFPTFKHWEILKKALDLDSTYDDFYEKYNRGIAGNKRAKDDRKSTANHFKGLGETYDEHIPQTEESKRWKGWRYGGLALKPSIEPIYFGQKPPLRPVSANVRKHGCGAINIEGCRTTGADGVTRNPSSVMHDGSEELKCSMGNIADQLTCFPYSKPRGKERNGHPTQKPLALMRHLVRLVNPENSRCLDPFMGSGTTGEACIKEKVFFEGIEKDGKFFNTAMRRLGCVNG